MKEVVKVKDVTHVYVSNHQALLAIEKINLTLHRGEFVSIVGPSGCGKTTLLSIIAGLIQPTQGVVYINGHPLSGLSPSVGYMLQQDYLFPWRTILQNTVIGFELTRTLTDAKKQKATQLLQQMGLAAHLHSYPDELSGGMRQRVALVRTLVTEPALLLLDEPFSALDYQTRLKLEDLVSETLKSHHKTAILVTHDINEAIAMSDRIIIFGKNPGKIRKEIVVPNNIREVSPFQAREQPSFHEVFHEIWQELEQATIEEVNG